MSRPPARVIDAIELCAGAGGWSLGALDAGWSLRAVELDPYAVAVHRRHVGPCDLADVTTWHPDAPAAVVFGGVPCQPFSTQGKRLGFDDPRGELYQHLIRIGREAGARVLALENVQGLATRNGGDDLRTIATAFAVAGFRHLHARVLDASAYGVHQRRKRLFLIGFRDAADAAGFAWPEPTHGPGLAPYGTARGALATWLEPGGSPCPVLDAPAQTITSSTHDETPDPARASRRYGPRLRDALAAAGLLDRPSTTISAGGGGRLARPGHHGAGEHAQWRGSVRLDQWQCAALQDFPPGWEWPEGVGHAHRLIGNAVPRRLGAAVCRSIGAALEA